jgi:hypothetical protein
VNLAVVEEALLKQALGITVRAMEELAQISILLGLSQRLLVQIAGTQAAVVVEDTASATVSLMGALVEEARVEGIREYLPQTEL